MRPTLKIRSYRDRLSSGVAGKKQARDCPIPSELRRLHQGDDEVR
jgi:hypothetical protein